MTNSLRKFTDKEYSALASFNPELHSIIIHNQVKENESPIEIVAKNSINCWQKILRFFGKGKLAHKKIHIVEVAEFLSMYQVEEGKKEWLQRCAIGSEIKANLDSPAYRTYHTLCYLAERAHRKGCDVLLERVSVRATLVRPSSEDPEQAPQTFLLNPEHTHGLDEMQLQQYAMSLKEN